MQISCLPLGKSIILSVLKVGNWDTVKLGLLSWMVLIKVREPRPSPRQGSMVQYSCIREVWCVWRTASIVRNCPPREKPALSVGPLSAWLWTTGKPSSPFCTWVPCPTVYHIHNPLGQGQSGCFSVSGNHHSDLDDDNMISEPLHELSTGLSFYRTSYIQAQDISLSDIIIDDITLLKIIII